MVKETTQPKTKRTMKRNLKTIPSNLSNFDLSGNDLSSLEGAPPSVDGDFNCSFNKLKTFKGAPETVKGSFICTNCASLTSLEFLPRIIHGHLILTDCGRKFTQEEVYKHCDFVGGEIILANKAQGATS